MNAGRIPRNGKSQNVYKQAWKFSRWGQSTEIEWRCKNRLHRTPPFPQTGIQRQCRALFMRTSHFHSAFYSFEMTAPLPALIQNGKLETTKNILDGAFSLLIIENVVAPWVIALPSCYCTKQTTSFKGHLQLKLSRTAVDSRHHKLFRKMRVMFTILWAMKGWREVVKDAQRVNLSHVQLGWRVIDRLPTSQWHCS